MMQSSSERTCGPQKATLERRTSRNRTRRNSIPDIKELSTEVKEKLRLSKRKSSSCSSNEQQPLDWEQNFVLFLARRRSSNNMEESEDDVFPLPNTVELTQLAFSGKCLSERRLTMTVPSRKASNPLLVARSVSAPDLTAPRRKLLRRCTQSLGSSHCFPGLDIARQSRSAELVRQIAIGWS